MPGPSAAHPSPTRHPTASAPPARRVVAAAPAPAVEYPGGDPRNGRRRPTMSTATPGHPMPHVEEVEIHGHIIDSLLLPKVLDEILTQGGSYVIKDIRVGTRQSDPSYARIEVRAETP